MRTKSGKPAPKLATGLLLILALAGCAKTTDGGVTETKDALCDQFRPTPWSTKDTDGTIAAAKGNNAVGARLCGWKPLR